MVLVNIFFVSIIIQQISIFRHLQSCWCMSGREGIRTSGWISSAFSRLTPLTSPGSYWAFPCSLVTRSRWICWAWLLDTAITSSRTFFLTSPADLSFSRRRKFWRRFVTQHQRWLDVKRIIAKILCFQDPSYNPQPEERPGGFQWGQNQENENINEDRE